MNAGGISCICWDFRVSRILFFFSKSRVTRPRSLTLIVYHPITKAWPQESSEPIFDPEARTSPHAHASKLTLAGSVGLIWLVSFSHTTTDLARGGQYLKVPRYDRGTSPRRCQTLRYDGTEHKKAHAAHRQGLVPKVSPSIRVETNPRTASLEKGVNLYKGGRQGL